MGPTLVCRGVLEAGAPGTSLGPDLGKGKQGGHKRLYPAQSTVAPKSRS